MNILRKEKEAAELQERRDRKERREDEKVNH